MVAKVFMRPIVPEPALLLVDVARLVVFPSFMAFAASSDLVTMTISNRLSLGLAVGFLALAVATGMGLPEIGFHFAAGFLVLAMAFACYSRGWIGGGDAKLAAATALWLGFDHLYDYLLCASLFGGVLTLAIIRFRQLPLPKSMADKEWVQRLHQVDMGVPYGIALALAALVIYPSTKWMNLTGL